MPAGATEQQSPGIDLAIRHDPGPRGAGRDVARRNGFAGIAYAFAVAMLGTTLPTPLYPLYAAEFGFTQLTVTVVFATYAAGVIAALVVAGGLSDQIGRRRVLLPGLAFSALSAVVFLLADGLLPLLAGRALSGLSAGLFTGTATATLVDLAPGGDTRRGTLVATVASMGGLGFGPLLAGVCAQFGGAPLRLPFWVNLGLLIPAALCVWAIPAPRPPTGSARLRLHRLWLPPEARPVFLRAAPAAFAGFAVLGLFAAVVPGFLGQILGIANHAIVGLVVFAVFTSSAAGQVVFVPLLGRRALAGGCVLLLAAMALLALGLALSSLVLVVAGGVVAGCGAGVSFRAGLTSVTEASPAAHRAEAASSFFVVAYLAISVPVVGVGLLADVAGLRTAGLVFAGVVAAIALAVLTLVQTSTRNGGRPCATATG
jgi:MFS family permease